MRIQTEQEIATICFHNNELLYGTYVYETGGLRKGCIYKYTSDQSSKCICTTSGTFQIATYKDKLYALCSKEIMTIENWKISINKKTEFMNIQINFWNDIIITSHDNGFISLFDLNLKLLKAIQVCKHIIWSCNINQNYIFAGCDCGKFLVLDKHSYDIKKNIMRDSGVTSIHFKDNLLYVGSYDEHIVVYDLITLDQKFKRKIGGGIWRMVDLDKNNIAVACMYEGIKILDNDLNIIKEIKTVGIAYGLDFYNEKIVFSSFYEKYFEIIDIKI